MNPSTAFATVLIDELVRGGVRDLVLAPGSRSAPLAHAALDAERAGRLRLHVRVDERSGAFLALGLAKASGRPVPVVTTSGTAVANLHPAVLEAHHAGVPLVVLTADRQGELRGTGANQTTHQPGIFGTAVRLAVDLPAAESVPDQNDWWRSMVCRALVAASGARGEQPGPVHLNAGFRQPLVPTRPGERDDTQDWPESLEGRPGGEPWVRAASCGPRAAEPIAHVARTLVVVGSLQHPEDAATALEWAAARGYPVIAEPFGQIRPGPVPGGPLALTATDWLTAHAPARVVVIGRMTLARAVGKLLRRRGLRVEAVSQVGPWADPSRVVSVVHPFEALFPENAGVTDSLDTPALVESGSADDPSDAVWRAAWARAAARLASLRETLPWGSGLALAAAVTDALPTGSTLVLGSSNPVRDVDLMLDRSRARDLVVHASRGLAGIDGVVSTAIGVALATDRPTCALMGDLTFLHDTNGLLIGPDEPRADLTIVVANDDGGGIFTTLEHGAPQRAEQFERIFGTPTGTDLAALCRAHGIEHQRLTTREGLTSALAEPPDGIRVIEVPIDRGSHRQAHADLRAAAAAALTGGC